MSGVVLYGTDSLIRIGLVRRDNAVLGSLRFGGVWFGTDVFN